MSSKCTCETYGVCSTCRDQETDFRESWRLWPCLWCEEYFPTEDMFRVGKNRAYTLVCGPDCPDRPVQERKHEQLHTYRVGTTVVQHIKAEDIDTAQLIARRNLHKRGVHHMYNSHAQQQKEKDE